jgi:hypothetical protein
VLRRLERSEAFIGAEQPEQRDVGRFVARFSLVVQSTPCRLADGDHDGLNTLRADPLRAIRDAVGEGVHRDAVATCALGVALPISSKIISPVGIGRASRVDHP